MAALIEPNIGLNYGWDAGESGWSEQMNENLKSLGTLVMPSVISASVTTPPFTPIAGDRYILPIGASGIWAGADGTLVRYNGDSLAWESYPPKTGWQVLAQDTGVEWYFNNVSWVTRGSLYPLSAAGLPSGAIYNDAGTLKVAP